MERQPLTGRRCAECDCYMEVIDRSPAGALTLLQCPLGHVAMIDANGQTITGGAR